jgi:tRNA-Thr(GGU) m(6)t(6)A37 methyltransferase TsaA
MEMNLTETEVRVLGSLMEKSLSTPDYYPLSLNALTNACNQKSSRDPVVSYSEATVQTALDQLAQKGWINRSDVARVPKYEERLSQKHNFLPRESGALCVLLLRGPQTVGEIRARTSRMCRYNDLDEVITTLADLESWGFVRCLTRRAGHKEPRYAHLLSGDSHIAESAPATDAGAEEDVLDFRLRAIGYVKHEAIEVPRHWSVSDVEGMLEILPEYEAGLADIDPGDRIVVLFCFDRSEPFRPDFLTQTRPRDDQPKGVFSICSPRRPNPIGLSVLEVLKREKCTIWVRGLDMFNNTPILDIKPHVVAPPK